MSLFYNCDVATLHVDVVTLGQCCDNVATLGKFLESISRHCCRCRDIEKQFFLFQKIITFFLPHFISVNSVHACEYKSIKFEESQFKHEQ